MKRLSLFFVFACGLFAAGTVNQNLQRLGQTNTWVLSFEWTGDPANGSVPSTPSQPLSCCQGYLVTQVEIAPHSPAPTGGYSVVVADAAGADILAGAAATLSSSATQAFSTAQSSTPITGTVTLIISGQNVASAKGTVFVFMQAPALINVKSSVAPVLSGGIPQITFNTPLVSAPSPLNTTGTASCPTCATGAAPFTNLNLIMGAGGQALQIASGITIQNGTDMTLTGGITTGSGGGIAGKTFWTNGTAPSIPANSWGFVAPATITTSWAGQAPNASPGANQIMLFPAPTSNVSQWVWTTFSSTNLTDTANLVYNNAVNTGIAAMTLNMSASTVANAFRVPVGAGLTAGANGVIAYDSTANSTKIRTNAADSVAAAFAAAPAGGKCAQTTGTTGLLVEASGACGGGGGLDLTTTLSLFDDILPNSATFGNTWKCTNVQGTGCNPTFIASSVSPANHPGQMRFPITNTAADQMDIGQVQGDSILPNPNTTANWETTFTVQFSSVTSVAMFVGFADSCTVATPSNAVGVIFDTAVGTTFRGYKNISGTPTNVDTTVTATNTNWFRVSIRATTAGTGRFRISTDGGSYSSDVTLATLPTATMGPCITWKNNATQSGPSMWLDLWTMTMTGLTR